MKLVILVASCLLTGSVSALSNPEFADEIGCYACHKDDRTGNAPAFIDIAKRYGSDDAAWLRVIDIVKHGGKGQWNMMSNGSPMPPYFPRLNDTEIKKLVQWIRDLKE
jgi:cytochrome c